MAGGKMTPRQKMINMMYLVLLALLALNVSQEVLNAFHLVNNGLIHSNKSLAEKTSGDMDEFHKLYEQNQQKAQEFWDKANRAEAVSDTLYNLLQSYKKTIIDKAGGLDSLNDDEIVQRENLEVATRFLAEDEGAKRGKDLQQRILATRDSLIEVER